MKDLSYLTIALILLFSSCNSEDSNPCGGLILDVVSQTLYIELLDDEAGNLIENGTFNKDEMSAEVDGTVLMPIVYDESEFSNLPEELKNLIVIPIFGEAGKETLWKIHLNDNEQDALAIDIESETQSCSGIIYDISGVSYNGQSKEIEDFGFGLKISVVK